MLNFGLEDLRIVSPKFSLDNEKILPLAAGADIVVRNTKVYESFEDSVKGAMEAGFTEPDPRIDLSGVDVQRKILILAREAGFKLEMSDVENIPFLPEKLMKGSVSEFLEALPSIENTMKGKLQDAQAQGKKLRYFATFENGKAKVGLEPLDANHPFCSLEGAII